MIMPSTPDAFTPKLAPLSPSGWTVTASDQSPAYPAANVVDGNPGTFWHSLYSPTPTPLPHNLTIGLRTVQPVSGLTYLPRQDGTPNGTIGGYAVTTSMDGTHWSDPVVSGTWNDDPRKKTAVFPPVSARFVRLTAETEAGGRGPWSSAAEIEIMGTPAAGPPLPRAGWTAAASDASPSYPARNVLDGNGTTTWHTVFGTGTTPLPHTLTVDMGASTTVAGLRYLPRQDASPNGTIGRYTIWVSVDGTSWGAPVASGQWADDRTSKTASFPAVSARYVRLTALSEAGNRGPWSSAAEVDVLGVAPPPGTGGLWDAPIGLPIVPVSAAVLPGDRLLTFAAYDAMNFNMTGTVTRVSVIDLATRRAGQTLTVDTRPRDVLHRAGAALGRTVTRQRRQQRQCDDDLRPGHGHLGPRPLMNIPRAYEGDTPLSDRSGPHPGRLLG